MRLALGPLLYYWSREQTYDFYRTMAAQPVSTVYLGEVVCNRRTALRTDDWLAIANDLRGAGKDVVLSSRWLLESEADVRGLHRLADNGEFAVEANDYGAVRLLSKRHWPWIAGPALNVYSPATAGELQRLGVRRIVAPIEADHVVVGELASARVMAGAEPAEIEVFAFGRLPLAISARCFAARRVRRRKDECGYICQHAPSGLPLATRDGDPFLRINGVQLLSERTHSLLTEVGHLQQLGVSMLRLSPQTTAMPAIIAAFDRALRGEPQVNDTGWVEAANGETDPYCAGYWHGYAGMAAATSALNQMLDTVA